MKRKVLKQLVCLFGMLFMTFPAWSAVPSNLMPDDGSLNQTPVISDLEGGMFLAAKGGGGGGGGQGGGGGGQGGGGGGSDSGGGGGSDNGGGGGGSQGGGGGGSDSSGDGGSQGGSDNGSGDGDGEGDQVQVRDRAQARETVRTENCESESCEQGDKVRERTMSEENNRNSDNAQ